jgi:ribose transport system substrate-binding protein
MYHLSRSCFTTLAFLISLSACSAGGDAGGKTNDDHTDAKENPFHPADLQQAVDALHAALGDQPQAGDVKISVVANRHSNYWTPAQIGTGRAASAIGCFSTFDATSDGMSSSQAEILERKVAEGFAGISVSAIDASGIMPTIADAVTSDVNVITFDSDAASGSMRSFYLGTVNYEAGKAAGDKMVELIGAQGGTVAAFAGLSTAANAQERIRGIEDAFAGTGVSLVKSYFDEIDFDLARGNVESALDEYTDLAGIIGVYAYNGPIALSVLEDRNAVGSLKLVAFDLDVTTLEGLANGKVDAAIGQRPYWMGYLSVYSLYSMAVLGQAETMNVLAPWLDGDVLSTGQDIVTPDTIGLYAEYLETLGISNN